MGNPLYCFFLAFNFTTEKYNELYCTHNFEDQRGNYLFTTPLLNPLSDQKCGKFRHYLDLQFSNFYSFFSKSKKLTIENNQFIERRKEITPQR